MLELNSKGKDLVKTPTKTRLDSRFLMKNSFLCLEKTGLGMYSIEWR